MTNAKKLEATKDVPASDAQEAKAAKKTMTDSQKLKALVAAAKANGWTLPDEIEDEE